MSKLVDRYYRAEVHGAENLSEHASVVVGTHNGGIATPDAYALAVTFWRRFGLETPAHGMAHDIALRIPVFGDFLRRLGAVPAGQDNARIALEADRPVIVYPGGDVDALKPFAARHRALYGARRGFIRLALRQGAPVVPVVSVGAHETMFVLPGGEAVARMLGVDRLMRVRTVPLAFGFPFGFTIAGLGLAPLPSKVVLSILPAIHFDHPPEAADDSVVVEECFEQVRRAMQDEIDRLVARRRLPVVG